MKKYLIYKICLIVGILAVIASCKSGNTVGVTGGRESLQDKAYLEEVIVNMPKLNTFSAKMSMTVNLDGKKNKVSGTIKIRKDEIIQLSIVPLLGIEVARVELTPEEIIIIDRIHKQYVQVNYTNLSLLKDTDINFNTLQSLFLNEIFLPGHQEVPAGEAASFFSLRRNQEEGMIHVKKSKALNYVFTTLLDSGFLKETRISKGSKYELDWKYDDFKAVNDKNFPASMNLSVEGTGKTLTADFNFSRMSGDEVTIERTKISDKYKQINTDELLKLLSKL